MFTEEQLITAIALVAATMRFRERKHPTWSSELRIFAGFAADIANLSGDEKRRFADSVVLKVQEELPLRL